MNVSMDDITTLIKLQLGIRQVEPSNHLREDLGAESLDMQNIIMALEDKYRINITDEETAGVSTVSDFHHLIMARV